MSASTILTLLATGGGIAVGITQRLPVTLIVMATWLLGSVTGYLIGKGL